jgi:methyltransferase (TIGR00027 family)
MVRRTALPMSTARGVALLRAMEMRRPPSERATSDPYASAFVPGLFVAVTRAWVALGLARRFGLEPMMNFAVLRERFVEDVMREALAEGVRQIVILGAGFDTRAYRLDGIGAARVFEIDHPATQAAKRRALAGVVEPLPGNVVFVPVDFDRDSLADCLAAAGYDETAQTLFVWQGVIMYLTPEGIDRTLGFIAGHAGSRLVFDTFYAATLGAGDKRALHAFTRALGEEVTFGLAPEAIRPFLAARGFDPVEIVDGEALRRLYPAAAVARRPVASDAAIVAATVAG